MKKIRLLAIFVLFCYLLLPTKIHTQIDSQHGKNTFQYFQFSMIYWRVAILDDVESVTGIHVFEYFSNALNNDADREKADVLVPAFFESDTVLPANNSYF